MGSLSGKVAVVTGASRGMGKGIALVLAEQGRLDILVNNAIAIPDEIVQPGGFWEKPLSNWELFDIGVRAAFVAAWYAARFMVSQRSGLIVAISGYVGVTYTYSTIFGTTKSATDRMARDMAIELKPYRVASISLWQGLTMTELAKRNLANSACDPGQFDLVSGLNSAYSNQTLTNL